MDYQKIISLAVAVCWLLGMASVFIAKGAYVDHKQMMPRMSVTEQRTSALENEQARTAKVLETIQKLLSQHQSQLAVTHRRNEKSESERGEMAADIKALLRIIYDVKSKVDSLDLVE